MPLSPEDIEIINESLSADLTDQFANPGNYSLTQSNVDILKEQMSSLSEGSVQAFLTLYNSFVTANMANMEDGFSYDGFGNRSNPDTRTYTKKDSAGNPIITNGEPEIATVDMTNIFPSENFDTSFYDTLNREQIQRIQDMAVSYGLIDYEQLGGEVNGVKGPITEGLINGVLQYVMQEYEDFEEGSIARTKAEDNLKSWKAGGRGQVNSMFGGATDKLSDKQILSREMFQLAFMELGQLNQAGKKAFDVQRAIEIKNENKHPVPSDFIRDIEDLYYSLYGEQMSDTYKDNIIKDVAEDWSPWVSALVAQDKYLRADEIYNTHKSVPTVDPVTEKPSTKYVELEVPELKEAFNAVNPIDAATDKIKDDFNQEQEWSQNQKTIRDVQKAYTQYMMGRG